MPLKFVLLLVLSSLVNAALGAGAFLLAGFATSPDMADITMRIGYYVLHAVAVAALVGAVVPWVLRARGQERAAVVLAVAPAAFAVLAVLAFLLLDSWLRRTFGR